MSMGFYSIGLNNPLSILNLDSNIVTDSSKAIDPAERIGSIMAKARTNPVRDDTTPRKMIIACGPY